MAKPRIFWIAGLIWSLCAPMAIFAQDYSFPLIFQEKEFDFGEIGELGGSVYHHFVFVNSSKDSIWILDATAPCHCTTGDFPKEGIPPGATGMIKLTYNPKDRPWEFQTGITLSLKNRKETLELKAKGKTRGGAETARFSPIEFVQKFLYNEKAIEANEAEFKRFVEKLVPLLEKHKDVKIQIESSASQVPTKSYSDNQELTRQRAKDARLRMLDIFAQYHADFSRLMFMEDITLVQGPEYSKDYKKQMARYLPFQYVKIKVF